jgi:hypothetical protein
VVKDFGADCIGPWEGWVCTAVAGIFVDNLNNCCVRVEATKWATSSSRPT